jgi:transcriptional regulator with XRE-family HTH domain
MSINFFSTPKEVALEIANRAREKRLSLNLSQKTLAERSGVSLGSLKKFEQRGKISLESLLQISYILDSIDNFDQLFTKTAINKPISLEDILQDNSRHRGRK